jgi:NADH-quinone oxidoreductase subunit K
MNFIIFLALAYSLFFFGLAGIFLNKKNIMLILMSVELMLLSLNFGFLIIASYIDDQIGQLFAVFIITIAAAESAIGLAILIVYFRVNGTVAIETITKLNG